MFRSEALKAELSVVVFCSLWSYQIIVLQSGWRMTNCRFRCKHRPSIPLTFPLLWGLTSACWLKSWPLLKLFSQQSKLWAAKWKWNRPANIVHSKCSDYLNWCLSVFASSRSHLFLFVPDVTLLYMLSGCRREQWTTKAFVRSPAQWRMYSKTRLSVSKSNQKFCLSVCISQI